MLQYLGAEDSGLTLLSSKPTIPTRNWARFSESGFDTHPLCTPHIREIPECGSHAPLEVQKKKKNLPRGCLCIRDRENLSAGHPEDRQPEDAGISPGRGFRPRPSPVGPERTPTRSLKSKYLRPESVRTQSVAQPKFVRAPSRSGDLRAWGHADSTCGKLNSGQGPLCVMGPSLASALGDDAVFNVSAITSVPTAAAH